MRLFSPYDKLPGSTDVTIPSQLLEEPSVRDSKPVNQDPTRRPLTFKQILETDITPQKEEYLQLKELDMRMHVLRFSNSIAKRYSGANRPDAPPIPKLNRCFFCYKH